MENQFCHTVNLYSYSGEKFRLLLLHRKLEKHLLGRFAI